MKLWSSNFKAFLIFLAHTIRWCTCDLNTSRRPISDFWQSATLKSFTLQDLEKVLHGNSLNFDLNRTRTKSTLSFTLLSIPTSQAFSAYCPWPHYQANITSMLWSQNLSSGCQNMLEGEAIKMHVQCNPGRHFLAALTASPLCGPTLKLLKKNCLKSQATCTCTQVKDCYTLIHFLQLDLT